ncbi:MAG: EamA family transporter [Thermoanaerobaculia bacterium]
MRVTWKEIAVFAVLTVIWGTTWAAIRIGLEGIPPVTGVAIRFAFAGLVLVTIGKLRGVRFGRLPGEARLWLINAATTFAGSYGIVYWGEQWVPSGLAAILFATLPLWVVCLGYFLLPGERGGGRSLGGVLLGFVGVAIVFSEDFDKLGGAQVLFAALIFLLAPFVSAVGSVSVKRWGRGISPFSIAGVPMLMTGGAMGMLALLVERGRPVLSPAVAPNSWLATLYLALFGSSLTFTLYFWLLARRSALAASLISYTVPVCAVLVGWLAFHEPVTWRLLAGGGVVLAGVAVTLWPGARKVAADLAAPQRDKNAASR